MQEDVEVLRRIVTESVQHVYQEAEDRVTRNCATCHMIEAPLGGAMSPRLGPAMSGAGMSVTWEAIDLLEVHRKKPTDATRVSGLANYVPGHGIVVQLEAPAPVVDGDVKAWVAADEAAPKRWELLLREARGEPEKNPAVRQTIIAPQQRRVHRLILTEKVLEVLADNGRNLRRLGPEERVTIAFTFRPASREERELQRKTLLRHYFSDASSDAPSKGASGPGASGMGPTGTNSDGGIAGNAGAGPNRFGPGGMIIGGRPASEIGGGGPRTTGNAGSSSGPAGATMGESLSTRTSAVAGDLLLRQERYAEAIAAYEKALREAGIDVAGSLAKLPLPADAADVVRKLVQAHVGAKQLDRATALLQWLERTQASTSDETAALRRIYLDLTGNLPTPDDVKAYLVDTHPNRRELLLDRLLADTQDDDRPSRVPARMTISCTRKQLDEVASGKLSKLDFAGQVTLKYYKAAPAGKGDKK
jgi:hypothetical protein